MIVLDTNVLSELMRPDPDGAVLAWFAGQRRAELCTTAISEAELAYGLALLPMGRRRDALIQMVARLLGEGLGGRVLAFDRAAAAAYGAFAARRTRRSRRSPAQAAPLCSRRVTPTAFRIAACRSSIPGEAVYFDKYLIA